MHPTLTWADVVAIHGSQCGISTKSGQVRSLLCNQAKEGYADEVFQDKIVYRVTASTNQRSVAALRAMVGSKATFHVFEKLRVNQWIHHGDWRATQVADEANGTLFLLLRK
jgi:hypothetical protein